ncbi:hypothetical protein BJY01DRAFT_244673 [Aspergillus pseudoustus]|uniref:Cytochrome P450 n=1 Tax=Aspergillus pseudoustus TaxID=1810923 RepID=A0ABR4KLD2_9EURO
MMLADAGLLLLYLGHQAQIPSFWTKTMVLGTGLWLLVTVVSLLIMFARAIFASRQLISLSNRPQTVIGKPLLFPVNFMHMRMAPVKDKFSNRFLIVGVPVGLQCRFGNLLAIGDSSLDVSPAPGDESRTWKRVRSHLSCWWTMDAGKLLHRGDHGVDLREKLDNFLTSQNEDPRQWPYAYLMSAPQFLGWCRNVVSWWYLYNEQRELDALILEINNSYWEKRNILIRVRPTSDKLATSLSSENPEFIDTRRLVQSLPSQTQAKFYGGEWHKYIFASPFEKVDGVVSQRMMDPLKPSAWTSNASFSNMTTLEDTGEVRMATRLVCDGPPIDPTQMSCWDVIKLIFRMTIPGILTTAEIVLKALKIRFSGAMVMNTKTPVRSGSVGRHITKMELDLEGIFRACLARCVANYPEPLRLTYLPCRSFTNDVVTMQSPASYGREPTSIRQLSVEPVDPAFYTRFINYTTVRMAIDQETKETGLPADPTSRPLIVSNIDLLFSILESTLSEKAGLRAPSTLGKHRAILSLCRGTGTFMDEFTLSSLDPYSRAMYMSAALRLSFARRFAFGSLRLLVVFSLVTSCLIRWSVLQRLSAGSGSLSLNGFALLELDPAWTRIAGVVLGYVCVITAFGGVKKWLVR